MNRAFAVASPVRCRCALIGWAVVLGGLAQAGCLSPAASCEQDADCPSGYRCSTGAQLCVRVDATADASPGDATVADRPLVADASLDRIRSDSARTDTMPSDRAGHDLVPGDHAAADQVAPDRADTDVAASERELPDQATIDAAVADAWQPDQARSDRAGPADANTCNGAQCLIDGLCQAQGPDPSNECRYCDPINRPFAWTTAAAGTMCGASYSNNQCCDGTCLDLRSDPANCGSCGTSCSSACESWQCCGDWGQPCCSTVAECLGGYECADFLYGQRLCYVSSCGEISEDCCSGNCQVGSVCNATWKCEACGGAGQPCCSDGSCAASSLCVASSTGSRCEVCGGTGQRCCSGSRCASDTCMYLSNGESRCFSGCGDINNSCCGGAYCQSDLVCDQSRTSCISCGLRNEPCCFATYGCRSWLTCTIGRCECGGLDQLCCDGTQCDVGTCQGVYCL